MKKTVHQKYIKRSTRLGLCSSCMKANSCPRSRGVPTKNQRRRGSGPCLLWWDLDKSRHIVPTALLVRVQCFRKDLYTSFRAKHKSYRPLDDQWVILSTSNAFYYFQTRRDEIRFAFDPPCFVNYITVYDWVRDILEKNILPNLDKNSEYDLKNFPKVLQSLWYL